MNFMAALKGTGTGSLGSSLANTMTQAYKLSPNIATTSGGFLNGMKNSFGNFTDWLFKAAPAQQITNFDRLGNVLGGAGAIYGAYNQQKMAKKNYELQKDAYNFNKFLANEELNRRKNMENKLQSVWSK